MKMRKIILPMSVILFLVLTLAGTYYVRLCILEKQMALARLAKAQITGDCSALVAPSCSPTARFGGFHQ